MRAILDEERPRLLTDENFKRSVTKGLRLHYPNMDILTIQEAQQLGIKDPELLEFAQSIDRILLTHDENTMPGHLVDFITQLAPNETSPGIWIVHESTLVGIAIDAIAVYWGASRHAEWQNQAKWIA